MTIRVLANLCSLVPGQVGGSEDYATRLLAAVANHPVDGVDVELASMHGLAAAHPELGTYHWHEHHRTGNRRSVRVFTESTWLTRETKNFDVVHHFGGRLPARRAGTPVLTVHDLQPMELPENYSLLKRRYLGWSVPRSARSAALVLTPSQWVAERVVDLIGVPEERLLPVSSTYRTGGVDAAMTGDSPRERPYLIFPAVTHPHKNHSTLIEAFNRVRVQHPDLELVLTGSPGRIHDDVMALVSITEGVVHLGRVSAGEVHHLIAGAQVMAFPSRYEGFGLPVIEAMHVGTAVITTDATALPEVVGEAGLLVGPDDIDGWVDALLETLDGSSDLALRVEAGRERAEHYSPARAAERLVAAWQRAAQGDL